jgi:hypothetical protein
MVELDMANESLTKRFCRCIKKVRKTVKARKGSSKESGAIAICVASVLQGKTKKRTLRKFHCKTRNGKKARVITQPILRGGGSSLTASRVKSGSRSYADPSRYYITLESDGESVKIHRPTGNFILREGDLVKGVFYLNESKLMPFKLKRISFGANRIIKKLSFKFIHEGKTASPTLVLGDEKEIQFENLRDGVAVYSDQFAILAKQIRKI